jgi:hypothetical protein
MTTIQLDAPEYRALADVIRHGDAVEFVDHGEVIARLPPRGEGEWRERLEALHRSFVSPPYAGNSVIDMRQESR